MRWKAPTFAHSTTCQTSTLGTDLVSFEVGKAPDNPEFSGKTSPLQNSLDRLQAVGFRSLTHRRMRQARYFPAHFDSARGDTPASV